MKRDNSWKWASRRRRRRDAAAHTAALPRRAALAAAAPAAPPAPPPPDVDTKAPRPRNVLMAEFEGLSKADARGAARRRRRPRQGARSCGETRRHEAQKRPRRAGGPRSAATRGGARVAGAGRAAAVDAATSAYQLALRDAVNSALAAVAANGEHLFVGAARAALERVALLDEDSRHVLARLPFVTGPWHPVQGSRASVESYAGGDAAAAMAALTRAGALVPLTEASPLTDAAEALPALVGDEVKAVYGAERISADD